LKILLIQPPVRDFYDTTIRLQPLGLCLLKAAAERFCVGVAVTVKDFHAGWGKRTVSLPREMTYLRDYYGLADRSPFRTFHNYCHFGAEFEALAEEVAGERPDLVGISANFSAYQREALACAAHIKARLAVPVVVGGSHVSAAPLAVLEDPCVDFVVRGEGERAFVELVRALAQGGSLETVPGLGFKKDGEQILNPVEENCELDTLPFADFSDLRRENYTLAGKPLCSLTTSRGCPHRCAFCSVGPSFGPGHRRRSAENVLLEMRQRLAQGYRVFDLEDDALAFPRKDFQRLLAMCIAEPMHEDARFVAMNGISYLDLDAETLDLMWRAGFRELNLSLVSTDAPLLASLRRPHSLEKYLHVVEEAYKLGFAIVSYQIVGLPGESLDSMVETMALMARLPVRMGASVFYLTPGCRLEARFPETDLSTSITSRSTALSVHTEHATRDDLFSLLVTARIVDFLKRLAVPEGKATVSGMLRLSAALSPADVLGLDLVDRLFRQKRLFAVTRAGLHPYPRFRPEIFFAVWQKAGHIRTRNGAMITGG